MFGLKPHQKLTHVKIGAFMAIPTVGTTVNAPIIYLDQFGKPMVTTPTPDSPPTWTQSVPGASTLAVQPDGSCNVTGVTAGPDVLNMSVVVGGKTFAAPSVSFTIQPATQVLTSVQIGPFQ